MDGPYSDLEAWDSDLISGSSGSRVDRYKLPPGQKARLSFSGSEPNNMFTKLPNGRFVDVSGLSGLDSTSDSRCVGLIDFDRDGLKDVLITNANRQTLNVFENRLDQQDLNHSFVAVRVVGGNLKNRPSRELANRDGVGARLLMTTETGQVIREVRCGQGLATQSSKTQLLGLGREDKAIRITVDWPSGKTTKAEMVPAGSLVTFFEDASALNVENDVVISQYSKNVGAERSSINDEDTKLPIDLSELPVVEYYVITSMATWCESCKNHFDELSLIKQKFKEQIRVVAIPIDPQDSSEKLSAYMKKFQPDYHLWELETDKVKSLVEYAVEKIGNATVPFTFLVKSNGAVIAAYEGFPNVSQINKAIIQSRE